MFLPHRAQVRQHRVGIAQAMHGQRRARNRSLRSYHYRNHRVRVLLHRPISGSAAGQPGVGGPVRVYTGSRCTHPSPVTDASSGTGCQAVCHRSESIHSDPGPAEERQGLQGWHYKGWEE